MRALSLALALVACFAADAAEAGPYLGADYQYTFIDWRNYAGQPQHFSGGGNVHAGWRFGQVALEGGYEWTGQRHLSLSGETLDAFAYFGPPGWQPFVTLGAGHMTAKSTIPGHGFEDTGWSWGAGAGLQSHAVRAAVRYENLGLKNNDYAIVLNIGLEIGAL